MENLGISEISAKNDFDGIKEEKQRAFTFLGTLYSTMKKPGFSTARERPFKLGPATKVASVMVARSLRSPALKASEPTPVLLPPASNLPLTEAFIAIVLDTQLREERERERVW